MHTPPNLSITLDRDGEEPIYRQLIRHIRMQIESGSLPAGTRLPASRDLARQLNISRISVVNAYAELRAEGYLSAHAGRGTFVAKDGNGDNNGHRSASGNDGQTPSAPDQSIRDLHKLARKPGVINFSYGAPPSEFFPMIQLREAMNIVLEQDGAAALNYEMPEGYLPLRMTIRDYVRALGINTKADHILITAGAQQAIDLIVQSLLSEGDTIVTSNPTYIGIIDIARTRRVHLHGIESDDEGIRIDHLENYLLENSPKLIYVQPTFQNPTGIVMPMHRRRQLINLANEYKVPIVEDGVYQEFHFEGDPPPPLKALDENDMVLHVNAFTKMLLPGMRIGYIIANNHHFERLVQVKRAADISTSSFNQRVIYRLLRRGVIAQQLERNMRELKRRRDAALTAAEEHLPPGTCWNIPQGGMYLWIKLPRTGPTAAELFIAAIQMNVAYAIGNLFYTNNCGNYHLRVNYSLHTPQVIEDGFRRLGRAWRELACDYAELEEAPLI